MENKSGTKFLITSNVETAHKLRYEGYTELPVQSRGVFCFLNDGKKLNFNTEESGIVYTDMLCF